MVPAQPSKGQLDVAFGYGPLDFRFQGLEPKF